MRNTPEPANTDGPTALMIVLITVGVIFISACSGGLPL